MAEIQTIIFDLGNVLIDWNPDYVYRHVIPDIEKRQWFFENVCTHAWNEEQDAGRPIEEATQLLVEEFPEFEYQIRAYYERWEEMLQGPIHDSVNILRELKDSGEYQLLALTNWSAETFPVALQRFDFLHWFDGRVVSGEEKTRKPFKIIYQTLLERYQVDPFKAVFTDDNVRNLIPAEELGIQTVHFQSPSQFRADLKRLGVKIS